MENTPPQVNPEVTDSSRSAEPRKKIPAPSKKIPAPPKEKPPHKKSAPSPARQKIGNSEVLEIIREAGALAVRDREVMSELLGRHYQDDSLVCIYDVRVLLPGEEPHDIRGFFTIGAVRSAYLAAEALPTLEQHLVSGILKPALSLLQSQFVEEPVPKAGDHERPGEQMLTLPDIRMDRGDVHSAENDEQR